MLTLSEAASYTLRFINQTHRSVFLTGKAGTGKTTLLREIMRTTHKNTVVVAPTGIAALNAGGVTIHSMFQLPFAAFIPTGGDSQFSANLKVESRDTLRRHFKMSGLRKSVINNMELLIIDEVSMLRADLLDAMDFMMQSVRRNKQPFGGVQVLYIGDLLQLPPVVKDEEWHILKQYYKGKFFFHAHVTERQPPLYIELSTIYRQSDSQFISILNNLRENKISAEDIRILNQYVKPDFDIQSNEGFIMLTTHNAKADAINQKALSDLTEKAFTFYPEIVGDFPEKLYPLEDKLELRKGAQVMFVKNDPSPEKRFFNGKMGVVTQLSEAEIRVLFPDTNISITVETYEWQNIRYNIDANTKEITEEVLGTFVQFPLKLAWAITVHKSQGLTFDKAALDVSRVFQPGQAYVALSRLRSIEGLVLLSSISMHGIGNDEEVMAFSENKTGEEKLGQVLEEETRQFVAGFLVNAFNWGRLSQDWRDHSYSYKADAAKSEKSVHHAWAKKNAAEMELLVTPARNFTVQLQNLFKSESPDFAFIAARLEAAITYFQPRLEAIFEEVLWKKEEIARMKKAKAFYDEISFLDDEMTKAITKLFKAAKMIEIVRAGQEVSKETLASGQIQSFRRQKVEMVQSKFKAANATLVETTENRYATPKKKKEPKKSTVVETFELWEQKHSVKEIAELRKLTTQTINGHLAKLIRAGAVQVTDLLPEDRLRELAEIFIGFNEETVSPLKEKYGDRFTWDELKLFHASIKVDV